jgi:hypothetical protein
MTMTDVITVTNPLGAYLDGNGIFKAKTHSRPVSPLFTTLIKRARPEAM